MNLTDQVPACVAEFDRVLEVIPNDDQQKSQALTVKTNTNTVQDAIISGAQANITATEAL